MLRYSEFYAGPNIISLQCFSTVCKLNFEFDEIIFKNHKRCYVTSLTTLDKFKNHINDKTNESKHSSNQEL